MAKSGGGANNQSQQGNPAPADAGNAHNITLAANETTAHGGETIGGGDSNAGNGAGTAGTTPSSTDQIKTFFAEADATQTNAVTPKDPAASIGTPPPAGHFLLGDQGGAAAGGGAGEAIAFGNAGNPNVGFNTDVQNENHDAGALITYGAQGGVGAGLVTVGYGNQAPVSAGLVTIAYGNQAPVNVGITTLVLNGVETTTVTPPIIPTILEPEGHFSFAPTADLALTNALITPTISFNGQQTYYDGEEVSFNVTVTNSGPDTANNVIISDTELTNLDLHTVSFSNLPTGATADVSANNFNVNLGSLAAGASETFTVNSTINAPGNVSETLIATTTTPESTPTLSSTIATTAVPETDLSLTKTVDTTPLTINISGQQEQAYYDGEKVTFQIQVSNTGPDTAQNVVVSDSALLSLSNISYTPTSAATSISGENWTIGSLASGTTDTLTVTGYIVAGTTGSTFTDSASVVTTTYQASDPTGAAITSAASGTGGVTADVVSDADLSLVKTLAGPSTITVDGQQVQNYYDGEKVTFTVQVSNSGPDAAQGVVINDSAFSNLTNISLSSATAGTISGDTWTINSLGSGVTDYVTVTGNIIAGTAGSTFSNTASVTTTTYQDQDPTGVALTSTATSTAPVIADADLSLVKTLAGPSTITLDGQQVQDYYDGEKVTFTVQVSNSGPDAAQGVVINDSAFSNLTNISLSSATAGTISGDTWTINSLGSGVTDYVTVTGNIIAGTAGSTFSNTASVTTTTYQDQDPTGVALTSTATSTAPVIADADLSLVKTLAGPSTITLDGQQVQDYYDGEKVTFTVQVSNSGPDAAQGVVINDSAFSNLTNISLSSATAGTISGDTWTINSLGSGVTDYVTVTGNIIAGTAGSTFSNTASATTTTYQDQDPTGVALTSTATSTAPVIADADLSLVKTLAGPSTITLDGQQVQDYYDGEKVTFTVQVSNSGPDAAQGVVINDSAFSNLTNISLSSATAGTISGDTWTINSLGSGVTDYVTVTGNIIAGTAGSTFSNTASVTTTTYQDQDPTGVALTSTATSTAPVIADADLSLVKTLAGPSTITLDGQQVQDYYDGEKVTFTVQVSNSGPDAAQGVVINDSAFSNLTNISLSSATAGTISGDTWTINSLGSGVTDYVTVTGNIIAGTAGSTFSNTASVTTTTYQDQDPTGVALTSTATSTAPVIADADLSLVKTLAGPSTITLDGQQVQDYYDGEKVTFTVQVSNSGPDAAQGVVINDSAFSNLTNISLSSATAGTISGDTWTINSLGSGVTDYVTVTGNIIAGTAGSTFSNTASATTTTYQDQDPTGVALTSTATSTAPVIADADLSLVKTLAGPSTITLDGQQVQDYYDGEKVTFTVQVSNSGPDAAQGVVINDSAFSNLTNISLSSATAGTISGDTWTINSLGSGVTDYVTVTGNIIAGTAGSTFSNTASVTTTTYQDQDPTGVALTSTATSTAPVIADADLSLVKTLAGPSTITLDGQQVQDYYDGEKVTFTVQVSNSGPDAAQGVVINDSAFSNLTNISLSSATAGTISGDTWTINSLGSGVTDYVTVTGNIIAGTAGSTFSNTASVTTTTYQDQDPTGVALTSTATSTAPVIADADLSLVKTLAGPSTITLDGQQVQDYYDGEKVTFTVQVSNSGPDAAQGVVVSDSAFSNLSNISLSSTAGTVSGDSWSISSLGSGITDYITVTGNITAAAVGSTFSNTASVTTTTYQDQDPTDVALTSTATSTAPVIADADLSLVKTLAGPSSISLNGQQVQDYYDGEKVTFTVQVSNTGPDAASNVVVSDSTFSNLTNISLSSATAGTISGDTWTISSLGSGTTDDVTVTGYITAAAVGSTFSNTASVTTSTYQATDPTDVALTSTATSAAPVVAACDLAVGITNSSAVPGTSDTYTITVTNNGPNTVTSFNLSNTLPSAFLSPGYTVSSGSFNSSTGAWTGVSLASGQSITLTVAGTLSSSATGSLVDSAVVATIGSILDTNLSNNTATSTVTLTPQANLAISITPSETQFIPGDAETYTITLKNTGPSAATSVTLLDTLAAQGFLNASSSDLPSGVTFNASTDTWTIGTLAAGATDTLYLTGTIPADATGSSYIDLVSASASDASSVSAQSSILPTGIVIAEPDIDTVTAVIGDTTSGNVITAYDANPNPGSALQADVVDAYGGAHIVSIGYGSNTASFSIPSEVHTNSQGEYVALAGTYGTLDVYQNGNYTYTVTSLPATTGISTLNDGSLTTTSSSSATEADWSGAGLYAFTLGTSYTNNSGLLALNQANGQVTYNTDGLGVQSNISDNQPPTQILYDPVTGQTDALAVDLHTNVTQATVTVSNLFNDEATGEQGLWQAYNSAGVEVGQGILNSSTVNYGSSDNVGTATIQVLGANGQPIPFEYIVFTALPYPNANPASNPTTDSSDYFVRDIQYTTAGTTPNIQDVFTYTMADSNNDQSSTTLTINGQTANLGVAIANSTQTPVPGASDTYTITVTNNGPSTVTSLNLTDTTFSGLNSLNQFVSYLNNASLTPSTGSYNSTTGAWTGLTLASGQSVTMTITGTINAAALGSLTNTVTVTDTSSGLADPILTNNSAESNLTLTPQAVLGLTMTPSETTVTPGTTQTYTLTITNTGLSEAYNVSITDTLPTQGLNNISSPNLPSGVTFNSSTDTWSIGNLAPGASETLYLSGTVASGTGATYVNQATASSGTTDLYASDASSVSVTDTNTFQSQSTDTFNFGTYTNILNLGNTTSSESQTLSAGNWLVLAANGPSNSSLDLSGTTHNGNYAVVLDNEDNATISLGSGSNQLINANEIGNDTINAGSGNNFIISNGANNTLTLNGSSGHTDILILDDGTNNITSSNGLGTYVIITENGSTSIPTSISSNSANTIITSSSSNHETFTLSGTSYTLENLGNGSNYEPSQDNNNELIMAQNSNSTIVDGNGNDYVILGNGTDSVTLGTGAVNVIVGTGNDTISVGVGSRSGSGTIIAGNGPHSITVGSGDYTILSGDGMSSTITAGNGNDIIQVGTGANTINVGNGIDYITTGNGTNNITVGGSGADFITIAGGNWSITDTATHTTQTGSGAYSTTIGDPVSLSITDVANIASPHVNGLETFTIQVQNAGPDPAPSIQISDLLSDGLKFVSDTTSTAGETYNSSTGLWTISSLAVGSTATLTITAQVETTNPVTNTATLLSVGEPNTGSVNQASATVTPTQHHSPDTLHINAVLHADPTDNPHTAEPTHNHAYAYYAHGYSGGHHTVSIEIDTTHHHVLGHHG